MSKYSKQYTRLVLLVSCLYVANSQGKPEGRKQRHSDDSAVDLTLSNTIDITTEESNIWWPWASYEEWKHAHHLDIGNSLSDEPRSTTAPRSSDKVADQARFQRRVQHKRSKKMERKSVEEQQRREREKQKLERLEKEKQERLEKQKQEKLEKQKRRRRKEERHRKLREERERRRRERKRRRGRTDVVVVEDAELEEAVWGLLQARWGDFLNNQADNECTNEIQHCKPKCLLFNKTNSYICACPTTHELDVEEHRCRRK